MPAFDIIPAIDLIDGQCVRLSQGNYDAKTIYDTNPVKVAQRFETLGVERLHVVDLDGAKAGKLINTHVLQAIAQATTLKIDFGGGVKTEADVETILNAGAQFVTLGSMAVKNKKLVSEWIQLYGANRFLIGCDVKGIHLALYGWQTLSNETIFEVIDFYLSKQFNHFFCTDISKDGMLQGPSIALYQQLLQKFPDLNLIASGGVSNDDDLNDLLTIGCKGAIVGKAIYENRLTHLKL